MSVIHDDGPWRVSRRSDGDVIVASDDFTHDVVIQFSGDFGSIEDRIAYANGLAEKLNKPS